MENSKSIQPYKSNFGHWIQRLEKITEIQKENQMVLFLIIDCSGSMSAYEKLTQARNGALAFTKNALEKGYSVGVIKFNTYASLCCEPQRDISKIKSHLQELTAEGSTNMVEALYLAKEHLIHRTGLRTLLVATDGLPNDVEATLNVAKKIKEVGIEILVVATSDADKEFLDKLASRRDLAVKVPEHQFKQAISSSAEMLPQLPQGGNYDK
jgi:Ca-activated chloride channel family protein